MPGDPPFLARMFMGMMFQLVVARNHRRVRAGKPPLDVEAEIEREIAGLEGL